MSHAVAILSKNVHYYAVTSFEIKYVTNESPQDVKVRRKLRDKSPTHSSAERLSGF